MERECINADMFLREIQQACIAGEYSKARKLVLFAVSTYPGHSGLQRYAALLVPRGGMGQTHIGTLGGSHD